MFAGGFSVILHKIYRVTGGQPRLDVSHTCFCVVCFVLGFLFNYVFTTDGSSGRSYPVNNMTLRDVSVLVDMEASAAGRGKRYEELAAISAMQMVNTLVSEYRAETAKNASPAESYRSNEAVRALRFSAGDCYTKVYTMMEILKYLHIPAREINYWHIGGTNIGYAGCEVYYNGSWHYFDPTWGMYFRNAKKKKILSLENVLALPKEEAYACLVMDAANMQNALYEYRNSFQNVIEKEAQITVAGNSNIIFDFKKNNSLSYIPTYVGILRNRNGEKCEARYTIVFDGNMKEVNVYYANLGGLGQIDLVDGKGTVVDSVQVNEKAGVIAIRGDILSGEAITLQAQNPDKLGVLNIENIEGVYEDGLTVCAQKMDNKF